nr:hypothetical protein [Tanacetum cinerariifolium]
MLFRDRRAHAYTRQLMETEISEIRELQAADRRRQTVILELLRMDDRRSTETSESRTALQGQITALQGQGTDLASYTQRFQELALLCERMFSEEADKIEKYVGGLLDMIHESVVASKPKTMQEAIEIATELMDKKVRTFTERETASKRKLENTSRTTWNQQQQQHSNKRQNTGRVYTVASSGKKQYGGSKPLCAKCNHHHDGPCAPKVYAVGRAETDPNANVVTGGRNNAPARVYAVGRAETDPNANVVT